RRLERLVAAEAAKHRYRVVGRIDGHRHEEDAGARRRPDRPDRVPQGRQQRRTARAGRAGEGQDDGTLAELGEPDPVVLLGGQGEVGRRTEPGERGRPEAPGRQQRGQGQHGQGQRGRAAEPPHRPGYCGAAAPTGVLRRRRATPVWAAARATPSATASTTRLSKTDGMMYSSDSSLPLTIDAMPRAASIFIASLTSRARTSSRPRKKPGKHSTWLIWFG